MTDLPTLKPVPHAAQRRKIVEVEKEIAELQDLISSRVSRFYKEMHAALKPIEERHRQEIIAAEASYRARMAAAESELETSMKELEAMELALCEAIGKGERAYSDDYENPLTCALTGCAVFEDDDFLHDHNSGETVLKAALPWPVAADDEAVA